jgi:hypothetical protein
VSEILDCRRYYRWLKYLVKWVGYDHPIWELPECVENAPVLVHNFRQLHPDKPHPENLPRLPDETDNNLNGLAGAQPLEEELL